PAHASGRPSWRRRGCHEGSVGIAFIARVSPLAEQPGGGAGTLRALVWWRRDPLTLAKAPARGGLPQLHIPLVIRALRNCRDEIGHLVLHHAIFGQEPRPVAHGKRGSLGGRRRLHGRRRRHGRHGRALLMCRLMRGIGLWNRRMGSVPSVGSVGVFWGRRRRPRRPILRISLMRNFPHSTELRGEACHRSAKASGGEDLQVEKPVACWDFASFYFHATLAGMLRATLIWNEVV